MKLQMGSKLYANAKPKFSILSPLFLSLILLLILHLTLIFILNPNLNNISHLQENDKPESPIWYNTILQGIKRRNIKIGLVNLDEELLSCRNYNQLCGLANTVTIKFDHVAKDRRWEDFFPEWIDEEEKWSSPSCPKIPMADFEKHGDFDVVMARAPCGHRDVFRLQVNLVVANLLVTSGLKDDVADRMVYGVFVGECGPMWEIFRCDDRVSHEGDYWVYKPDLRRLKQKLLMPVGSCQLAALFAKPGKEALKKSSDSEVPPHEPKEAYVTVLHSSETYVCGAIALAQSLIQTNTTKDLILLADDSFSSSSLQGLRASGWKIKHIERIRSPNSDKKAYNKWNYSKLRIWQLTDYDKVIFIDSDLIALKKIDSFFFYPQLSAVGNDKYLFNSGIMVIEPSQCTFQTLMEKRFEVQSYNGGDQGYLNEMFTWWHRWPRKLNHLKVFEGANENKRGITDDIYAIHYLGMKPWLCYMDYDCNWDMSDHRIYASDEAHMRWWQVYKTMPKRLQSHCALNKAMDVRLRKWRGRAKNDDSGDKHWKINVKDPRRNNLRSLY